MARNLKIEIIMATCYLSLTLDFVGNCYIDVISGQPRTRAHNLHLAMILFRMKMIIHFEKSKKTFVSRPGFDLETCYAGVGMLSPYATIPMSRKKLFYL